jgi:hypothetical protein
MSPDEALKGPGAAAKPLRLRLHRPFVSGRRAARKKNGADRGWIGRLLLQRFDDQRGDSDSPITLC